MNKWDHFGMRVALAAADCTNCVSGRKVGAVFMRDHRILATGVNGLPSGIPHHAVCLRRERNIPSGEQTHLCGCVHAEINAITNAAREGIRIRDSILYCTTKPCRDCVSSLINVGVNKIIYLEGYDDTITEQLVAQTNIEIIGLHSCEL